ncbi:MAG: tetratricopeptide repeat protein [Bacteroidales bacterium]|nr:tetratricopeptide repeat protein [Bacteroidales bacterium]
MKRRLFYIFLVILTCSFSAFGNQKDTLITFSSETEAIQKINELIELSESNRNRNPEKSVVYGLYAIKISKEIENYELQCLAEFLTGFACYIQNDFENALIHLDNSLELSRLYKNSEREALSLNRIGNTYQLMGEFGKALNFYEEAMTINRDLQNDQEIARTLTNLGSVYRLYGNYELAINQHLEALSIYEGLQNNEGIAWSALNIARLFKMMKNYQKSINYVNQSLNIYQKIEEEQEISTGVTLCYKELGSIYYEMGDLDYAVEYSERVLARNKSTENKLGIANSLSTLGMIYFDAGNYKKSEGFLIQAKELKDSLNDNTEISSILRYLGKIYLIEGKTIKAREYLNNSLDFAQNQNLKEDIKETYLALSELYKSRNNPYKAFYYYRQFTNLKDSLNNQKINELELQYEFDKEQRRIKFEQQQKEAEQKAKLQKQKIFTWVFVSGFLFMIVLAYVIFKSYQRKKKTNIILTKQHNQIAHQNTIITDSIEYARRIQSALFPQEKFLKRVLAEYFIYMKPKNIVSGDFYWVSEKDDKIIIAVSDCTGHGVPGAFMSMLGIAFLNEIVNKSKTVQANSVLDQLRKDIIDSLHQEYGVKGSKDGMDMALCIIDRKTLKMQYAGAYNSVFVVREKEVHEIKADKMPIGIHAVKVDKGFANQEFELRKQDMLYLFSDGYVDQFGGEKGLKFKQKSFKDLLINISDKSMDNQKTEIEKTMKKWQGEHSQLDDMMIMGVRI